MSERGDRAKRAGLALYAHSGPYSAPSKAKRPLLAKPTRRPMPFDEVVARGKGVFFDHHIDLREPEGDRFTAWLVERFHDARNKQRRKAEATWRLRLRKLAANAMRAHFFRDLPYVLYSRAAAAKWYQDKPKWVQHGGLKDAIEPLLKVGLLNGITGQKMPKMPNGIPSWTSSFWGADEFIQTAIKCGITKDSIVSIVGEADLVQLYAPKPKREYDRLKGELVQPRKGERIWFDATPQTEEWAALLAGINAFYRQQDIALGLSEREQASWLAKRNSDPDRSGPAYRLPELFATDLYRVFNNGSSANPAFGKGGRLFGGWWMYLPEELRKAITINGEPTVELDYAACHPRMLYHKRDLPGDGELYMLPEIEAYEQETGVKQHTYRPCIKWLMQILINGRGRPDAVTPPEGMHFPPDYSIPELVGLIESMHKPICNDFKSGAGLGLMRIESDIALEVVTTAMAEGWTALPIHDSFITSVRRRDRLKTLMTDAYVSRLGKQPVFKDERRKKK